MAISGIARTLDQLHNHVGGVYLAGLWTSNLIFELCWRTVEADRWVEHRRFSRVADCYVAPSWSWASVDGLIVPGFARTFPEGKPSNEEVHLNVLEVVVSLVGDRLER